MWRVLILVLIASVSFAPAQAQSPGWQAVVYDEEAQTLFIITPEGVQAGFPSADFEWLLAGFNEPGSFPREYPHVAVDGTYIAALDSRQILIGNLAEGCCVNVQNPVPSYLREQGIEAEETGLGGISPDGSLVVVYYVEQDRSTSPTLTTYGELIAINTADSSVVDTLPFGNGSQVAPDFYYWGEDGLHFDLNCFLCTHGSLVQEHIVWQPGGSFISYTGNQFEQGSYLPATGELIEARLNRDYPSGSQEGPVATPNVITYRPGFSDSPTVIYANPAQPHVFQPEWVLNGNAFLVRYGGGARTMTIVYRNGSSQDFELPDGVSFLMGTPEGWLAKRFEDGMILHFASPTDYQELGQVNPESILRVISAPILGENTDLPPMQSALGTVIPTAVPDCSDDTPSRLRIGQTARVTFTDGSPLNLRDGAGSEGNLLLKMPEGTVFTVLEGPACIGGVNWWQLQLEDGTSGWASEGANGDYYIEPYIP